MPRVIVIGAGVGGLTTAAVLARAGLDVTVLEAQVYPGGCASTYFHQGYRFDTGATLAGGFYPGGPMDKVAQAAGINSWPAHPVAAAMVVHLPDGTQITRYTGEARWDEYRFAFGDKALSFFRWQERTADAMWDLALRLPPWPPQSPADFGAAASAGMPWLLDQKTALLGLAQDAFRPVTAHLSDAPESLRLFTDAQLLISAQATSERANALYGAAALDLPRRGVVHLAGGMGTIAETLVEAVRRNGGARALPPRGHPNSQKRVVSQSQLRRNAATSSQPTWSLPTSPRGMLPDYLMATCLRRCVACPPGPQMAGALLSCTLG